MQRRRSDVYKLFVFGSENRVHFLIFRYDGNDGELDAALRAYNACQVAAEVQHVIDSTTQLQGGVVSRRSECTPSSATATAVSSQPVRHISC
jgi:hypothetical protein